MKKTGVFALIALFLLAGCAPKEQTSITVVTREAGSGTRDAFTELTGILLQSDGVKIDRTTKEAVCIDGTQGVMSNVVGNQCAIGYVSLGSLNATVKAVAVDGVAPTAENVKSGAYMITRPFNIATKADLSALARHFISYLLSADGQAVIEANGYIAAVDGASAPPLGTPSGKLVIAGSSSVSPVMEKLKESYLTRNPNATIEIQVSDSSSGMTAVLEGTCEIGMVSRALKGAEADALRATTIALDGIAVIVNAQNAVDDLTREQIRGIFTGELTTWDQLTAQ